MSYVRVCKKIRCRYTVWYNTLPLLEPSDRNYWLERVLLTYIVFEAHIGGPETA